MKDITNVDDIMSPDVRKKLLAFAELDGVSPNGECFVYYLVNDVQYKLRRFRGPGNVVQCYRRPLVLKDGSNPDWENMPTIHLPGDNESNIRDAFAKLRGVSRSELRL